MLRSGEMQTQLTQPVRMFERVELGPRVLRVKPTHGKVDSWGDGRAAPASSAWSW